MCLPCVWGVVAVLGKELPPWACDFGVGLETQLLGCDGDCGHGDGKEAALCPGSDHMDASCSVTWGQALPLPQFPYALLQGNVPAHRLLPDTTLGSGRTADEGWGQRALGELNIVSTEPLSCPRALHPPGDSGSQ